MPEKKKTNCYWLHNKTKLMKLNNIKKIWIIIIENILYLKKYMNRYLKIINIYFDIKQKLENFVKISKTIFCVKIPKQDIRKKHVWMLK